MIISQVTLEIQKTVKKPNGAEKNTTELLVLPATKERINQSRLDEFSMQGLGKRNRYKLNAIGEYESLVFMYFYDEKNVKYKTVTWERNPKNNQMTLEGVVANGI